MIERADKKYNGFVMIGKGSFIQIGFSDKLGENIVYIW